MWAGGRHRFEFGAAPDPVQYYEVGTILPQPSSNILLPLKTFSRVESPYLWYAYRIHGRCRVTDEQIVRLVAEKVLGYVSNGAGQWCLPRSNVSPNTIMVVCDFHHFNPITSDADACMVLDKMAEDGRFEVGVFLYAAGSNPRGKRWEVEIDWKPTDGSKKGHGYVEHDCRRRAICLAALKAVGVEVE